MKPRRSLWGCSHSSTITTITAGLAREVCEACGRVTVNFVEPAVRLHDHEGSFDIDTDVGPTEDDLESARGFEAMVTFEQASRLLRCPLCGDPAAFMIPDGLRCDEHAWQAAAGVDWDDVDPWVPIKIDRSRA